MNLETILSYTITYFKENGLNLFGKIFLGAFVFAICSIITQKIVTKIREKIESNSVQPEQYAKKMSQIIGSIVFILLMIFTILIVFQVVGFDVALIMGGISLGLGFAMETTIGNMISGIFLMTNKKVKLGDYVKFMGSLNLMGTIEEINIRYTVITTFDKRRVIVPNSVVAATPVQTYASEPLVRGEIAFTLPRHVLIPQVKEIMFTLINSHKAVAHKDYTSFLVSGFDTVGIQIKSYFFVDQTIKGASAYSVGRKLKEKIFKAFKKYGIDIPYKHLTLTVE